MLDPTPAVAFLDDFCRPPWTLTAWRSPTGGWIETKACKNKQEAFGFISKHRGHMLRFLLGYSRFPLTKEPTPGDVLLATGVAIAVPTNLVEAVSKRCLPSVWIEGRDHSVLVWRYVVPANAISAQRHVTDFALRFSAANNYCRVDVLPLMVPLPIDYRFEVVLYRKHRVIDLLSLEEQQTRPVMMRPEIEDEKFVRGDQVKVTRGLPVIKKDWVPGEAITLLMGPPKQGKSLFVAKLTSYIVSGGSYEPGGWKPGWWDGQPVGPEARGSVIVCEEEDPRLETLARIKAAIGLPEPQLSRAMAKVHVRVLVPDISVTKQLKQITDIADMERDCRMISLSPFSRSLRIKSYTEDAVRDKIAPIQAWIRGKDVCVIAIVHLDDGGKTSGSQVIPRVCRSGISFNSGVMTRGLSNYARMGATVPFRVEEAKVIVDGVPIDTSRIIFK
jgi:hypothetical protein